jgi:tetratricopeptide (TPR) repeat protein
VKWLVLIAVAGALGVWPAESASKTDAPVPKVSTSTADAVEADFQRVMALDDAAHEAIEKLVKASGSPGVKDSALRQASLSLQVEQKLEPVKKAYEDFLQRHPKHARGQLAFGSFLNDLGEEAEARKRWEKALELDPSNPAAYNNLANSYGETGPVAKAFELYAKAIEMNPRQAIYYHNLASVIVLHRKDAAEHYRITEQQALRHALELYRLAQKFDPTSFQLATDLAQVFYGMQPPDHDGAISAWSAALTLARNGQEREATHLHLARVKAAAGKLTEARQHLDSVTDPTLAGVKSRLARELMDKALPQPTKDDGRRLTLPGQPK